DVGQAGRHLLLRGGAVARALEAPVAHFRAELHDVRNVDLLARQAHRFEDLVELLPGGTDEGFSLLFLLRTRRFPDEDDLRHGIAHGEDDGLEERTEGAGFGSGFDLLEDRVQRLAAFGFAAWR